MVLQKAHTHLGEEAEVGVYRSAHFGLPDDGLEDGDDDAFGSPGDALVAALFGLSWLAWLSSAGLLCSAIRRASSEVAPRDWW